MYTQIYIYKQPQWRHLPPLPPISTIVFPAITVACAYLPAQGAYPCKAQLSRASLLPVARGELEEEGGTSPSPIYTYIYM